MTEHDIIICGHGSGKPSLKRLDEYSESRFKNGKGLVCVKRHKKMNKDKRLLFRQGYSLLLGRNIYSQAFRDYVFKKKSDGKFYSDCSSSGMGVYAQIGLDCGLLNTAGIYNSKDFEEVPVKIKNGHILNPEILHTGDAFLYKGTDPSRPKMIGHVEFMYKRES